jgi:hypothetical protein
MYKFLLWFEYVLHHRKKLREFIFFIFGDKGKKNFYTKLTMPLLHLSQLQRCMPLLFFSFFCKLLPPQYGQTISFACIIPFFL